MYRTAILLLGLSLPTSLLAQKNDQSYCDMAKAPKADDCFNIKYNGVKDSGHYDADEWWAGNCKVKVKGGLGKGSIDGKKLKTIISNIVDNCDSGFHYHDGVRVDVVLCTLEQGSVKSECKSPLQKVEGLPDKKRDIPAAIPKRRHLTDVSSAQSENPSQVFSRDEPYPGIICGGGPGSAEIDACKDLLDELKDKKSVKLPYKKETNDCQLNVWPTSRDKKEAETSHIWYSVEEDLELCADKIDKYVGLVSNYHGFDYHMFFGQFCGAFGSGSACSPAGK